MPDYGLTFLQIKQSVLLNFTLLILFDRHFECTHILVEVANFVFTFGKVGIPQNFIDGYFGCTDLFLRLLLLVS
jgi:hypothetical protein